MKISMTLLLYSIGVSAHYDWRYGIAIFNDDEKKKKKKKKKKTDFKKHILIRLTKCLIVFFHCTHYIYNACDRRSKHVRLVSLFSKPHAAINVNTKITRPQTRIALYKLITQTDLPTCIMYEKIMKQRRHWKMCTIFSLSTLLPSFSNYVCRSLSNIITVTDHVWY